MAGLCPRQRAAGGSPGPAGRNFRFELEPRNVFVGKSARIIRSLLTDRDASGFRASWLTRARASSGLVSRIIQHLISQGFLEKKSRASFVCVIRWG